MNTKKAVLLKAQKLGREEQNQLSEEHLLQDAAANMIMKQAHAHSGLVTDVNAHNQKIRLKACF